MAMACLVLDVQLLMAHLKVLLKNMFPKTRLNDFYGQTRNAPQAEMGDREILCLVEKASQCLPSHFSKHLWSYGPDLCRPDHILAHGYILCRRAWRTGEYEAYQRTEKYDTK